MRRASSALLASALRAGQAATSTACWRPASTAASAASVRLEDAALPPPAFIVGAARPPPTPLDLAAAVEKVQVRGEGGSSRTLVAAGSCRLPLSALHSQGG